MKRSQQDIDVLALTIYLCSVGAVLLATAIIMVVKIATGGDL